MPVTLAEACHRLDGLSSESAAVAVQLQLLPQAAEKFPARSCTTCPCPSASKAGTGGLAHGRRGWRLIFSNIRVPSTGPDGAPCRPVVACAPPRRYDTDVHENDAKSRCPWCLGSDAYIAYHDAQWGVPLHDDRALFELLLLEGAQAGLSWSTILNKRDNYRKAFDGFDARKIARYTDSKIARLLADPGIVRNRLKVAAAVHNAKAFLAVQNEFGSFDSYIWRFVGGKPRQHRRRGMKQVPARTPESDAMSKDLVRRGFKFVGSTICYAYMQATGMVNDHLVGCFRHPQVQARR
jgi:DNA-3-methyladenine glycosylase I